MVTGPLSGLRVLDLAEAGALSLCGQLLSGMGAEVIRVGRGASADALLDMVAAADVVVAAGDRGVAPGPEECLAGNPRLVYGRTALAGGHDEPAVALYLVVAVLAALAGVGRTGEGQVVDDTLAGCPFHNVYGTADGHRMAVSALEPDGYREFVRLLGVWDMVPDHRDPPVWAELRRLFTGVFRTRTQAEWCEVFDGSPAHVRPVGPRRP